MEHHESFAMGGVHFYGITYVTQRISALCAVDASSIRPGHSYVFSSTFGTSCFGFADFIKRHNNSVHSPMVLSRATHYPICHPIGINRL
jgi:hypothetical protein